MAAKPKAQENTLTEQTVDIGTLLDNPRNPNKHPEEQLSRLMASLKARGQIRPVLARRENRMLIAGHGVRMSMQRLGLPTIRVLMWDVDQPTADAAMLADNRLGALSDPDNDLVAELLREMPQNDWLATGYSSEEAAALISSYTEDQVEVKEVDVSAVDDKFWISVYGPLGAQADALQHLKLLMQSHPGITVELGITTGF